MKTKTIAEVVADHLFEVLQQCNGNISEAARALGEHRRTMQRMLRKYRIRVKR